MEVFTKEGKSYFMTEEFLSRHVPTEHRELVQTLLTSESAFFTRVIEPLSKPIKVDVPLTTREKKTYHANLFALRQPPFYVSSMSVDRTRSRIANVGTYYGAPFWLYDRPKLNRITTHLLDTLRTNPRVSVSDYALKILPEF